MKKNVLGKKNIRKMGITESRKQNNYVKCKENKNRGNNQINR
jgi:hypothetical protein